MWLFKKLREIEWIVSLWTMATTSTWFWLAVSAGAAVLTAIATIAYDWAAWINSYGRPGWIIAAATAIAGVSAVVGLAAWSVGQVRALRRNQKTTQPSDISTRNAEHERKLDETLRRVDRSVFLLLVNATNEGTHRALWKAWNTLPDETTGDNDEELLRIKNRLREHEGETDLAVRGTRWWIDFSSTMTDAERAVDIELRTAIIPNGIHPMIYREYVIASRKREALKTFLENAIAESDFDRDHTLGMLREQKLLHDTS